MKVNIVDVLPGEVQESLIQPRIYQSLERGDMFTYTDGNIMYVKLAIGHVKINGGFHLQASDSLRKEPVILYEVEIYARKIK